VAAAEKGNFSDWFEHEFEEQTVVHYWGKECESCRRYYTALQLCRPEVFLDDDQDIIRKIRRLEGGVGALSGDVYADLKIPNIFCWGEASLARQTREFLKEQSLSNKEFKHAFHWPMIDKARLFYAYIADFIIQLEKKRIDGHEYE
jgi:hypothetical protein